MTHVLQGDYLVADFVLGKFFAHDVLVLYVIRTVDTPVHTVVGEIERRKHNYSVAVEREFDFFRDPVHFFNLFRDGTGKEHCRLPVGEAAAAVAVARLFGACFLEQRVYQLNIVFIFFGVAESFKNLFVIDKFFRFH